MEHDTSHTTGGPPASSPISPSHQPSTRDSSSSHENEGPNTDPNPAPRRRRVPGGVTPNACTNCKKARAKCDGVKPACKRCITRNVEDSCHYELHAKSAKDQMMREIHRLQQEKEDLKDQTSSLAAENGWIIQMIWSLKDDKQCVEIVHRLKRGESHISIVEWLGRPFMKEDTLSSTSEYNLTSAIQAYHQGFIENKDPRYWTSVTTDVSLIEHLLALYLTWVHPVHMLFEETPFMTCLRRCEDNYCSAALVNIVCAMSCHLLHNTWGGDDTARPIILSLRSRFLEESRILLKDGPVLKMTTIQTHAIMFLIEVSMGDGLLATSHLRLATESLVAKRGAEQSHEAAEVASWGIFTLHTAWSGLTYVKPSAPVSPNAHVFQGIRFDEESHWPYDYNSENALIRSRPSFAIRTASELARLYRIIHGSILLYCGSFGKVNAHELLKVYERFLTWEEELPSRISQVLNDEHALPHALSLHIQYHTALVHLFHPLLSLHQTPHSTYEAIRDLLLKHAKQGLALLVQHRQIYSTFYQPPLQLFHLVHICDALITHDAPSQDTPEIIRFCIESLEDAKFGYPVAGPLQRMFANMLSDCNIRLPDDLAQLVGPPYRYSLEDLLNACVRQSYRPPVAQLLPNMEATLAQDFMVEWQEACERRRQSRMETPESVQTQRTMRINTVLN